MSQHDLKSVQYALEALPILEMGQSAGYDLGVLNSSSVLGRVTYFKTLSCLSCSQIQKYVGIISEVSGRIPGMYVTLNVYIL